MDTGEDLTKALDAWRGILGEPEIGAKMPGRGLWPVFSEHGRRCLLKRLSPWRNLPEADEARVLQHLAASGVPVAGFMITDRGGSFAEVDDRRYFLLSWLDHDDLPAAELIKVEEAAGRAAAGLHRALADYPWPANSYTEKLIDALEGELLLPPDLLAAYAEQRAAVITALTGLPVQLVHGDLNPGNVLLRRSGVAGFIDFDHLPLAPRIWDVGKYLSRRLRRTGREAGFSTADGLRHVTAFLRGYQHDHPLTPRELAAVPIMILAGNVIEASYFEEIRSGKLDRRRLDDHDEVLRDTIEAARWQLGHPDLVADAVRSAAPA